jgi:hypothetical protein
LPLRIPLVAAAALFDFIEMWVRIKPVVITKAGLVVPCEPSEEE